MTKTNKIILGLAIVVVLIGAAMYYTATKDEKSLAGNNQTGSEQNSLGETLGNGIESIKDAMSKGLTLECSYTDEQNQKFVSYVKGKSVRSIIENPSSSSTPSNFLLIGTTMYMWPSGGPNQGFTITVDEEAAKKAQEQTQGAGDVDKATNTDLIGTLETYKNNCKQSSVDDSLFEKPANINFQDFSSIYGR
ncbi:MAG: hypothetical protein IT410_04400 [Candidatus Doudnabacteria bacterium]|nr:hypothetical protein [Candidatus Doudnabacteria bacterium]